MAKYIISAGSNLPDGLHRVEKAIVWLEEIGEIVSMTAIYSTPDSNDSTAAPYFNAIIIINYSDSSESLNRLLKSYEEKMGREHCTPQVVIDLDLLAFDGVALRPRDLVAPHFLKGLPMLRVK